MSGDAGVDGASAARLTPRLRGRRAVGVRLPWGVTAAAQLCPIDVILAAIS